MGLFDDLSDKLQDVAKKSGEFAQTAAKKSGELIEITKLNIKIKENESDIRKQFLEIGKIINDRYENADEIPEEFKDFIDVIKIKKETISELKNKINEIKTSENIDLDTEEFSVNEKQINSVEIINETEIEIIDKEINQ